MEILGKPRDLIKVVRDRPEVIVHVTAYTDVDGCEENRGYS